MTQNIVWDETDTKTYLKHFLDAIEEDFRSRIEELERKMGLIAMTNMDISMRDLFNINTPCPPDQKRTPDNESENPPASQE